MVDRAAQRTATIELDRVDEKESTFLEATLPHLDALHRVARHLCGDHHRAEDIVQETYLRAYAAFGTHNGPSTRAWLLAICVNVARSEGRRRSRRVVEEQLPATMEPVAAGRDVAETALARLDRDRVSQALARVPEEQRTAIVLMDLAGQSASEVAGMLGCSRNTVLSRAYRGRQRLAALLEEEDVRP